VVIDDFEPPIISDEIGNKKSSEFIVDVREFEDSIDDFRSSGAPT
jgi:hypothetical protein